MEKVIVAIGKFGRQTAFMNISLTAVGLLWNISDFLATEIKALRKQLAYAIHACFPVRACACCIANVCVSCVSCV